MAPPPLPHRVPTRWLALAGALLLCAAFAAKGQSILPDSPVPSPGLTDGSASGETGPAAWDSPAEQTGAEQVTTLPGSTVLGTGSGTVSGTVTDSNGDPVAGASVSLTSIPGAAARTAVSGSDGRFTIGGVPAGAFQLRVTADGFAAGTGAGTLAASQALALDPVVLIPLGDSTAVQVNASQHDVAEAEMKAEETQRLVGFIPNFYVTYDWHAAPLSKRQKFHLAFRTIIDPASIGFTAAIAGIEQANNTFSGYGPGPDGYGKRFGAGMADLTSGTLIGGAILPVLFRQDPRYFYKGTGSLKSRFFYALSTAVICRGDNGRWQANYSGVLGDLAAGAISNAYYPAGDRHGVALTFENGLLSAASDGVGNVVQEFLLRHLTPHAPTYESTTSPKTKVAPAAEAAP